MLGLGASAYTTATTDLTFPTLEYRGDPKSPSDADQRNIDVSKAVKTWHEILRAHPTLSAAAGSLLGLDAPKPLATPDSFKLACTPEQLATVKEKDFEEGRALAIQYERHKLIIAARIHVALGPIAKDKMEGIKDYITAKDVGNVKEMIDEITLKFAATTDSSTDTTKRIAAGKAIYNITQMLSDETITKFAERVEAYADFAIKQDAATKTGLNALARIELFLTGLHQPTYSVYVRNIETARLISGSSKITNLDAAVKMLIDLGAPSLPKSGAPTGGVILAAEVSGKFRPESCRFCRHLSYPPGTEPLPGSKHFASQCPHPDVSGEEKAAALKEYKNREKQRKLKKVQVKESDKSKVPSQSATTALLATGQPDPIPVQKGTAFQNAATLASTAASSTERAPAASKELLSAIASEMVRTLKEEDMWMVLPETLPDIRHCNNLEDIRRAVLGGNRNEPQEGETVLATSTVFDTGATFSAVGKMPANPRRIEPRSVRGIKGSTTVDTVGDSDIANLSAMHIKDIPHNIVSCSSSRRKYHTYIDFLLGNYILMIPVMTGDQSIDRESWGYIFFLTSKELYVKGMRARVERERGSDGTTITFVRVEDRVEHVMKDVTARGLRCAKRDFVEFWNKSEDVTKARTCGLEEEDDRLYGIAEMYVSEKYLDEETPSLDVTTGPGRGTVQKPLRLGADPKRMIAARTDADSSKMKFTKDEVQRAELADIMSDSLMVTREGLKKALLQDVIRDSPVGASDVARAEEIFGKDVVELTTTHRNRPTHAERDSSGSVDRRRKYERTMNGEPPVPDVVHADCAEIAGKFALCMYYENNRFVKLLLLKDRSAADLTTKLLHGIKFHMGHGFFAETVMCDKGTNFDADLTRSSLATFGIELSPVPTNKHDGAAEAPIRPARQKIMNALRNIAVTWGTTPPVAFLEGLLVHYGNMHAFQVFPKGDTITSGQRLFGRSLSPQEMYVPGDACMYKVPSSTITKSDESSTACVYLATRVTQAMTAIVYDIVKEKLTEVSINDLVRVKITAAMKEAVARVAKAERMRGEGLDIGGGGSAALGQRTTNNIASDDDPLELYNPPVPGEGGGESRVLSGVPTHLLQPSNVLPATTAAVTITSPTKAAASDRDQLHSFVSDVKFASPPSRNGLSARIEELMIAQRHAPLTMQVNKDDLRELLRVVIKCHKALRKKKHQVEYAYSMTVREAQDLFPDLTEASVQTELNNLFEKAFVPVDWKQLRKKYHKYLIRGKTLVDQKFDARGIVKLLKTRIVGLGFMQDRDNVGETSSPTISYSALLCRESIALHRGEDSITSDVSAAYLNALQPDVDAPIYLMLDKSTSAAALKLRPELKDFVDENKQLVGILRYALYGTLAAGYLWYTTLTAALIERGYVANEWEPCLFNREEGGIQVSVAIFVDDQMWWSMNIQLARDDIAFLNTRFGVTKPLKVQDAKISDYLGLLWDRSVKGETRITCPKQIKELLELVKVEGTKSTPGIEKMLEVDESSIPLTEAERKVFTSVVMKALYIAKHVRGDILVAVSFLSRRMTKATKEDQSKLEHLVQYISGTPDHCLLLKPGDSLKITAYCDAAYSNWGPDEKSTSGCAIYIGDCGRGTHNGGCPIYIKCRKQKCRSRSSAEAELICLSDSGSQILWTRSFMIAQGIKEASNPALVFEDNLSCIRQLEAGRATGELTRHLRLRLFWLKEHIDSRELRLAHLPTDLMRADLLTKSVTGKQFLTLVSTIVHTKRT